jgi:pyruvate dehydrogenase E2 component (dihydrolipoamide acetyltransferase)
MRIEIQVPRLGWNMEQGTFRGWLKADGDTIRVGDSLFTLGDEKAVQKVKATDSGILHIAPNSPKEGDSVPVGAVIGSINPVGKKQEIHHHSPQPIFAQEEKKAVVPVPSASPSIRRLAREKGIDLNQVVGTSQEDRILEEDIQKAQSNGNGSIAKEIPLVGERIVITPRARRKAKELGVDWSTLHGTGKNGRIRERDIPLSETPKPEPVDLREGIPLTTIRKTIADRMVHSLHTTAPVTLTATVDATNLVQLRNQFKFAVAAPNFSVPSFTDFFVKLTAIALQWHPNLNARWVDDRIVTSSEIHIGIAVDTDAGLLVPVIRNVSSMSLKQIAQRSHELVDKARNRKLSTNEIQGGTFTITNLGAYGIDAFTPIIHWPECAILGIGRIHKQPSVVDNQIVPRDKVTLSLTFDHRLVDGAPAARFLQTLTKGIESPAAWVVE